MSITYSSSGAVGAITLNRPEKHNCLNREMLQDLDDCLSRVESASDIRVLIVRGEGGKSFSTGADLKEFRQLASKEVAGWIKLGNQLFNRLENLPLVTMAVIEGYAYGGGLELALACDFRLATTNATFCSPELQHGWLPGWGGLSRLRRILGEARAKQLVFLGEVLPADAAERLGLVNWVVTAEEVELRLASVTEQVAKVDPQAMEWGKAALSDPRRTTFGADLQYEVMATRLAREASAEQ
jgi:enoyl-CoA hydratase/carnithine racemase